MDPFARQMAVASLIVSILSLLVASFAVGRQWLQDWLQRHKISATLERTSSYNWDSLSEEEQQRACEELAREGRGVTDWAQVYVRNIGRPIAVEHIHFDYADHLPNQTLGWAPALSVDKFPGDGFNAPSLPYLLADGETRCWAYEVYTDDSSQARRLQAMVSLANGKGLSTNELSMRLTPYAAIQGKKTES